MAKKLGVGVEITGKDTDFKASVERVKKATKDLKDKTGSDARAIEQQFKQVTIAIAKIAGAAIIAQKAFEFIKLGMVQTGQGADDLEKLTLKLKSGFDSLTESVYNLDFANVGRNWKLASDAAGKYADSIDMVNDRLQDLSVKRADVASQVAKLRGKQLEGTISKEETEQLKKSTYDLLSIETDIYNEAIKAQVKFIAEKKGLDASLFQNLESGINERVALNVDEIAALDKYVKAYEAKQKELTEKFTTKTQVIGSPYYNQTINQTDYDKINKGLNEYLATLPEIAKLQIFQQKLASDDYYKKLNEFLTKRNELEGEYASLLYKSDKALSKTEKAENKLIDTAQRAADARIESAWFKIQNAGAAGSAFEARLRAINANKGDVSGYGNAVTPFKSIGKGNGELEKQQELVKSLTDSFEYMFLSIDKGFAGVIDSALSNLEKLLAYMLAKAAIFGLLQLILPGSSPLLKSMGTFWNFIKPFADGGIVSQPTLAQIGEYAGAANNPEVIAPLSKLKGLIGNQSMDVRLKGKLLGSDIYFSLLRYEETLSNNT